MLHDVRNSTLCKYERDIEFVITQCPRQFARARRVVGVLDRGTGFGKCVVGNREPPGQVEVFRYAADSE